MTQCTIFRLRSRADDEMINNHLIHMANLQKSPLSRCIIFTWKKNRPPPVSRNMWTLPYETSGFQIWNSDNIILQNNHFSAFDPDGLLFAREISGLSLINNTFKVDTTGLYYNISTKIFNLNQDIPHNMQIVNATKMINNYFLNNSVDPAKPG